MCELVSQAVLTVPIDKDKQLQRSPKSRWHMLAFAASLSVGRERLGSYPGIQPSQPSRDVSIQLQIPLRTRFAEPMGVDSQLGRHRKCCTAMCNACLVRWGMDTTQSSGIQSHRSLLFACGSVRASSPPSPAVLGSLSTTPPPCLRTPGWRLRALPRMLV